MKDAAAPTPPLALEGLRKTYPSPEGPVEVLRGVSLALAPGESLALTGESGSGKSTLLHLAAGLDAADAGEVRIAGRSLTGLRDAGRARLRRDHVGLVFQQFNLAPSLTVASNIAFQARLAGLERRYPEQLSGGQQQRVAIGRALAARPGLVLADEPTGALDEAASDAVLDLLLELAAETGAALLMVTHSPRLAGRLGGRAHLRAGRLE